MKKKISVFVGAAMAGALIGVVLQAAPAKAGGPGNWYKTDKCTARNGTLVGKLTNYDINSNHDQRYHHSGNTYGSWKIVAILYDDESWPISRSEIYDAMGSSGTMKDGYQDFDIMVNKHWVHYIWSNGSASASCDNEL